MVNWMQILVLLIYVLVLLSDLINYALRGC